jgi:hypothetical protein
MKLPTRVAAVVFALPLLAGATSAWAQAAPSPTRLHVQRAEIIDRQGFGQPRLAATMLVPAGWRTQGQVLWHPRGGAGCVQPQAFVLKAEASDGAGLIELHPPQGWAANNAGMPAGECPQGTLRDARSYLEAWVRQQRPGARVLEWRHRPDKTRPPMEQAFSSGGLSRIWTDAGQLLIARTGSDGREQRETLATITMFSQLQSGGIQFFNGQALGVLSWASPEGGHDWKRFDAVWDTFRTDPQWQAAVQQHQNKMHAMQSQMNQDNHRTAMGVLAIQSQTGRDSIAEMARRGEQAHQTRQEIAGMQQRGYEARSASQDRMQGETVKAIRGIERWASPSDGGPVAELPNTYAHAWRLKDGSYVLTDSPSFDPNRDLKIEGEALKRVR